MLPDLAAKMMALDLQVQITRLAGLKGSVLFLLRSEARSQRHCHACIKTFKAKNSLKSKNLDSKVAQTPSPVFPQ